MWFILLYHFAYCLQVRLMCFLSIPALEVTLLFSDEYIHETKMDKRFADS